MEKKDFDNRVFVINKAHGPTSFDVVDAFRRVSGLRKVGHTGTLDPLAEGVLVLCTGRATRAVEHFMNLDKVYEFTVRLGVGTTTLDAEGEVSRRVPCPDIPESEIIEAAEGFVGEYRMDPPAFSALKKKGRRFYEMARAGEAPVVESRAVRIHSMAVTRIALPDVHLRIRCSRGTYVRSLARDFGAVFDLPAHIGRLVRSAVGPFRIEEAYPSGRIFSGDAEDLRGITLSAALDFMPGIVIKEASKRALADGAPPGAGDVVQTIGPVTGSSTVRILDEAGELLAVGVRNHGDEKRWPWVDSFRLFVDRRSIIS